MKKKLHTHTGCPNKFKRKENFSKFLGFFYKKIVKLKGHLHCIAKQVLDRNLAKNLKISRIAKNSWKFVYVPAAMQCRCPFNLTNYFDKKFQESNFTRIWDFTSKTCWGTRYMTKYFKMATPPIEMPKTRLAPMTSDNRPPGTWVKMYP